MNFRVELASQARKRLDKLPNEERARILAALVRMSDDPYAGDIRRLKGHRFGWRQRVGS